MALVIEDGTIVAGANSFVSRAEIIAYAASRGVIIPDDAASDVYAIRAMDYFATLCFRGLQIVQSLSFPRSELIDGDTADDWVFTIPDNIKLAQMQLALDSFNGVVLTYSANPSALLKRSKVGPLEREFFAPGLLTLDGSAPLTVASAYLASFMCAGEGLLKTIRV